MYMEIRCKIPAFEVRKFQQKFKLFEDIFNIIYKPPHLGKFGNWNVVWTDQD